MRRLAVRDTLWITVAWVILALIEVGYTHGAVSAMGYPVPWELTRLMIATAVVSGTLAGLSGGMLIVFVFDGWLRRLSYGRALLRIVLAFTVVFFGISIISGFFLHTQELGLPPTDREVLRAVFSIFLELDSIRTYLFWLALVLGTTVVRLVNQKYGPGVFRDFLLGRYFRPRREERVFMFLDLRGSTAIAERLGEERYFRLLQDLFRDVTPAILAARGQIYQYVGDEIVVSWPLGEGVAEGRCVSCFHGIRRSLRQLGDRYRSDYGLEPRFKAGLHCGPVMAGEVGIVKREITFSGDVLNTASRIQSKCNELGVDILISGELMRALPDRMGALARTLGEFALRGRSGRVAVYTL